MDSKRIWVAKDYDVGYKSKSHMAEFSPNPDGRNKRDTSYKKYKRRINNQENIKMKNRISINKLRNNHKLPPFLEANEYEEIVEESELSGQDLVDFLIQYDLDLTIDDNVKRFVPAKKNQNTEYKIFEKNNILYINLGSLSSLLKMDMKKLLEILENSNDEFIQNKIPLYPSTNNIYKEETKTGKITYLISYSLILAFAYSYKLTNPKCKLNQDFYLLISAFKKNVVGLIGYDMFNSLFTKKYFELFKYSQR